MKKITYSDVGKHMRKEITNVIQKEYTYLGRVSVPNGRSYFKVRCPFCFTVNNISQWSFAGSGKRCNHCFALFGTFAWGGCSYQFIEVKNGL